MGHGINSHVDMSFWAYGHLNTNSVFQRLSRGLYAGPELWQKLDRLDSETGSNYLVEKVMRLCWCSKAYGAKHKG